MIDSDYEYELQDNSDPVEGLLIERVCGLPARTLRAFPQSFEEWEHARPVIWMDVVDGWCYKRQAGHIWRAHYSRLHEDLWVSVAQLDGERVAA